jgi:hypothetical protein
MKKNIINIISLFMLCCFLMFGIVSCGNGGGGGGSSILSLGGGIGGTGISVGAITGFGSVILNDSTYGVTASTSITVNDVSGKTQNDLDLGMVAVVEFSGTNATSITVDDELKGRVDSVDVQNSTIIVMGNTVIVDDDTVFQNTTGLVSPDPLLANEFVEVHGLFDFLNVNIRATRVERIAQPVADEFEVKGTVSSFDNPVDTFKIGNLTVNFSSITAPLPPGIGDGSFVEAKGVLNNNTLFAVSVEEEDEVPDINQDDEFEIEGIITFIDDPQNPSLITVNGVDIVINGTEFENGDREDLAVGIKVEAEGNFNAASQFIAEKISLRDNVKINTEAEVDASGTITVFNGAVTVQITNFTELKDENGQTITAADINDGDYLEIEGFPGRTNSVIAIEIEQDNNPPDRSILKGPVQNSNEPDLTILGVAVSTDSNNTEFEIVDDVPTTSSLFFNAVEQILNRPGVPVVKARWDSAAAPFLDAEKVELEGDDE